MTEKELIHYGVLGMKWGKRKGKNTSKKLSSKQKIEKNKQKVKTLSDDDLRKEVNRLNMEQQYLKLTSPGTSKGKAAISSVLKGAAGVATATGTILTIYNNSDKIKNLVKTGIDSVKNRHSKWV